MILSVLQIFFICLLRKGRDFDEAAERCDDGTVPVSVLSAGGFWLPCSGPFMPVHRRQRIFAPPVRRALTLRRETSRKPPGVFLRGRDAVIRRTAGQADRLSQTVEKAAKPLFPEGRAAPHRGCPSLTDNLTLAPRRKTMEPCFVPSGAKLCGAFSTS